MNGELLQRILEIESNKDSIEIGTPSKGGTTKIYFDGDNPEAAAQKIMRVLDLRALANVYDGNPENLKPKPEHSCSGNCGGAGCKED